jgi:hypothetical protein
MLRGGEKSEEADVFADSKQSAAISAISGDNSAGTVGGGLGVFGTREHVAKGVGTDG